MKYYERPEEGEMARLLGRYGQIKRRIIDWDLTHMDPRRDSSPGLGEVVLIIFDPEGRIAVLKRSDVPEATYTLPQGWLEEGEHLEEAAVRVAREEAGVESEVRELVALHCMRLSFKTWELERWYFIVTCDCRSTAAPSPAKREVEEVRFIQLPSEMPPDWARSQWYLWVLKDASLVHPHFLLLGKPGQSSSR